MDMYVVTRLFSIRGRIGRAARLLAGAGACALVCGCIGNPFKDAQIDPHSPVAPEVAKIVGANRNYPTFASIPPAPTDVRAPRQYGKAAAKIEAQRTELEAQTAPGTWSLQDPEAIAAEARAQAGSEAAPQPNDQADAFANTQRKRATPPPPPSN